MPVLSSLHQLKAWFLTWAGMCTAMLTLLCCVSQYADSTEVVRLSYAHMRSTAAVRSSFKVHPSLLKLDFNCSRCACRAFHHVGAKTA